MHWLVLLSFFSCPLFCVDQLLYHGSLTDGIERLTPRVRFTPGEELSSPAGIYASDLPAFAAAHSFPWFSAEGIDLFVEDGIVVLEIPASLAERLDTPVYMYFVDGLLFSLLECESTGHTFRATEAVDCLDKIRFDSVTEAIEHYQGLVVIKES